MIDIDRERGSMIPLLVALALIARFFLVFAGAGVARGLLMMRLRARWKLQHISLCQEHILLAVLILRSLAMCLFAAVPFSFLHYGA